MPDERRDLNRTGEELRRVATEAAYVAVGLGVVGAHKAAAAQRQFVDELRKNEGSAGGPASEPRAQFGRAVRDLDTALGQLFTAADAGLEPVAERLPEELRRLLRQAQVGRDQLLHWVREQVAA